ncbi:GGDEF domain-containing protein [Chelatococcus reniformis]|uniref:diguanylate cyclase n=1 Tax=Chelatococcus reniformis TaxID=1494448 RepID=A0A916U1M6_9HYPH|nr:GGDEF domain-containing protein [Chelatococcus reniformis]GGC56055.1 GGDEF domain-containing protein [Chelatococcus reniformis]
MWQPILPANPAILIGPGVIVIMAIGFVGAWTFDRRRSHLLLFAGACLLFAIGVCSQVFALPRGRANAVVSTIPYALAVQMVGEALLRRSGLRAGWWFHAAAFAGMLGLIWYFTYVEPALLARVYVQNLGFGLILLLAALRLTVLLRGSIADKILFWTFFIFAAHFIPRTLLTAGVDLPRTAAAFARTPFWFALHLSLSFFGVALALAVLGATAFDLIDSLEKEGETDPLTKLPNRRGFDRGALAIFDGDEGPISVILADIDNFKNVNDQLGHAAGDEVLQAFAGLLRSSVRKADVLGRLGGEEFAIVVPGARGDQAHALAERIRQTLASAHLRGPDGQALSASFGVAERHRREPLWDLIGRADKSLYAAKRAGRNRALIASLLPDGGGNDDRPEMFF